LLDGGRTRCASVARAVRMKPGRHEKKPTTSIAGFCVLDEE
jgi:hypothetical protein